MYSICTYYTCGALYHQGCVGIVRDSLHIAPNWVCVVDHQAGRFAFGLRNECARMRMRYCRRCGRCPMCTGALSTCGTKSLPAHLHAHTRRSRLQLGAHIFISAYERQRGPPQKHLVLRPAILWLHELHGVWLLVSVRVLVYVCGCVGVFA